MEVMNLPAVVQPKAIYSPHPLSAGANRELFYCAFEAGESVSDYLIRNNIYPVKVNNFILSINDIRLSVEQWDAVFPTNGDLITLRACVHGGGDGGSNPLRTILTIAVLVASGGAASALLGIAGSGAALAGTTALISVGGMLLVNALVPLKTAAVDDKQPSPTYSLSGSVNRARLFEPLPLVFGVHRMFPDHGAKPFTAFSGNDQTLIQVFNFGLSDIVLSDFKIGDTLLSTYSDVVTEESVGNTGALEAYPTNVDSIPGGDLFANAGSFITKTTSIDTVKIGVDISGLSYHVSKKGKLGESRIFIIIEYRAVGSSTWLPFGATAEFPIINGTKEIIRRGYERTVAKGQYDVRVMLKDSAEWVDYRSDYDVDGNFLGTVQVFGSEPLDDAHMTQLINYELLKSFQSDTSDYTGQKRLALSIKASGQLSGRIDAFNAMVSSRIPVWNGSTFVTQVSSNPAWQFLALARGGFVGSRRIWGAGLPDARIDIDTIKLWGVWCDAKGLTCNIVFDSRLNVDAMLNTVARCGRATSSWASGKLGIVYDEANKPATAVFGMANIIRNTFRVNYLTGKLADEIIIAFTNKDTDYQRDTVSAIVPGVVNPINSVTIEIKGIDNEIQAGKEANLIAAEQFYRRRQITWDSDIEGLAVQRGDVAILAHDLTQWGYSGRLEAGSVNTLTLDRDVPFTAGQQHYVGIRYPDGSYNIYDVQLATGEQSIINLITPLPLAPDDDTENIPMDYLWFFEPKATPGKQVKITDVKPLSANRVQVTATDEDDAYYLSENDSYTYIPSGNFTDSVPTISDLKISESLVSVGSGFSPKVTVSWNIDGEYGGAFIRAKDEDNEYKDIGKTLDRRFGFEWQVDKTVTVEVVAFNLQAKAGPDSIATASLLLQGQKKRPADVANFSALQNGEAVILKWAAPLEIDHSGTIVRYGLKGNSIWENATPLTEITKGTNITSQDVPDGDWTFYAKHIDTSLNESTNAATSDVLFSTDNDIIDQVEEAPFIRNNAILLSDNDASNWEYVFQESTNFDSSLTYTFQVCVKKDNVGRAARSPMMRILFLGSIPEYNDMLLDTATGEFNNVANGSVQEFSDYWLFTLNASSVDPLNSSVRIELYASVGASINWSYSTAATGDFVVWRPSLTNGVDDYNLLADVYDMGTAAWVTVGTSVVTINADNAPIDVDGFVVHHTGVLVPSSTGDTIDLGWRVFDEFVPDPVPICTYEATEIDIGFDDTVRISGDIQSALRGNTGGVANPTLSVDYKKDADAYDGFEDWSIGNALCQQVKHKLTLDTSVGVAIITGFKPTVDLKERTDKEKFTVAAGGTTVTFAKPFHRPPFASAEIVSVNSGIAAFATVTNVTKTQAEVHNYNLSNTDAGGEALMTFTGV